MGRKKTKKKTGCLGKIIRFFIVLIALFVLIFVIALNDASNDQKTDVSSDIATQTTADPAREAEVRLDKYIAELSLTNECKTVIKDYLPDFVNFDKIVQSVLRSYDIVMNDGTVYYLVVMEDKTPASLMSSEKDSDTRTRYYDKFAK